MKRADHFSALRTVGLLLLTIALLAIAAHSLVDYPLRTPAMLAVAAALAGILAAAHRAPVTKKRDNPRPETAAAPALPAAAATGKN